MSILFTMRIGSSGHHALWCFLYVSFVIMGHTAALDNGLARTPVMGWNSWNAYGGSIDEKLIRKAADQLISLGLADAGYRYVNVDDAWSEPERGIDGRLIPNKARFPSGIPSLAEYVHSKGLKLGIYGDAGKYTCLGFPGSRGHEAIDALTWAEWEVDYLKFDNCAAKNDDWVVDRYVAMRDALNATGHPIVYSLCEWGVQAPWLWGRDVGNSWRTTLDISPSWESILSNLDASIGLSRFAGPGAWNDADMLEIGHGNLSPGQERAHFALWVMLKAPLLIGTDLDNLDPDALSLLKNSELIAVHQDRLGVAGELVWKQGAREVFACTLAGGGRAVVFFNRHFIEYRSTFISVHWSELGLPPTTKSSVRDLLSRRDLGMAVGSYTAAVKPQDVVVLKITPIEDNPEFEKWRPWHGQMLFEKHEDGALKPPVATE